MSHDYKDVIVFIGDVKEYLADEALSFNKNAKLITPSNSSKLDNGVYYCSLGDLSGLNEFSHVLRQATIIYYSPPPNDKWSDKKIKEWTEEYLTSFSCCYEKVVHNFENNYTSKERILELPDTRKTDSPQIWIAGCSISHGVGVLPNERYGYLLSEKLKMPVSFLTKSGASIRWASDQILRSDIRSNDIVFWGITSSSRITYWDDEKNKVQSCNSRIFNTKHGKYARKSIKENYFLSGIPIYESLQSINAVDNVMEKRGAKLIKGLLHFSDLTHYLHPEENLVVLSGIYGKNLTELWLDVGNDNKHPGPITHQMFYEEFIKRYYKLYS